MDWHTNRLSFAKPKQGDLYPAGLTVKQLARRQAMLAEAEEIVRCLPGPREAYHCLMTGRYDLMHALVKLLDCLPGPARPVRIATLSYNGRNLTELAALLDSGKIQELTLLCSKFFREHNGSLYELTQEELGKRGARVAAPRSHCKVITLALPDRRRLVLEGSANLRTNSNWEQLTVISHRGLHDWHAKWIDDAAKRYEIEEKHRAAKG